MMPTAVLVLNSYICQFFFIWGIYVLCHPVQPPASNLTLHASPLPPLCPLESGGYSNMVAPPLAVWHVFSEVSEFIGILVQLLPELCMCHKDCTHSEPLVSHCSRTQGVGATAVCPPFFLPAIFPESSLHVRHAAEEGLVSHLSMILDLAILLWVKWPYPKCLRSK